jgi:cysteine desulfurase
MLVNNEIGVVQDIAGIGAACARHGARFHVDAAQAVGKCAVDFADLGCDLMSLSAHKAYGPKGIGALLVAKQGRTHANGSLAPAVQLTPLQYGGGQERGLRAGTLATHQAIGMGLAFALAQAEQPLESERIAALRERLWLGLARLGGVLRNGEIKRSVPQILNVSFEGVEGESLLAAVRPALAVSTGSACTSALQEPSYVLRALGRSDRLSESSLRFGLGRFTSEHDIDMAVAAVGSAVARLRQVGGA